MNEALFYLVILLANVIQGITGFAGTILAMPFSVRLVGMNTAVPVLNVLGLLSGVYVFLGNRRSVDKKELLKIVAVMGPCVIAGLLLRRSLSAKPGLLYLLLGIVVTATALHGLWKMFFAKSRAEKPESAENSGVSGGRRAADLALLGASGLVHGMFVCGGPLLIAYLTARIKDKAAFRATISTVWIFLNGAILVSQIIQGSWNAELLRVQAISLPFLLDGMAAGSYLYSRMSQSAFMKLTYILLLIAGASLFFK